MTLPQAHFLDRQRRRKRDLAHRAHLLARLASTLRAGPRTPFEHLVERLSPHTRHLSFSKRVKCAARAVHPDKKGGSHAAFIEFQRLREAHTV